MSSIRCISGSVFALCLLLSLAGCGERGDDAAAPGNASVTKGQAAEFEGARHQSRGMIKKMLDQKGKVSIAHEEMPGFTNKKGEVVGMKAMTMPFPVGESIDMADYEVGDKVAFVMVLNWDEPGVYYIAEINKLPSDTELNLPPAMGEQ